MRGSSADCAASRARSVLARPAAIGTVSPGKSTRSRKGSTGRVKRSDMEYSLLFDDEVRDRLGASRRVATPCVSCLFQHVRGKGKFRAGKNLRDRLSDLRGGRLYRRQIRSSSDQR